MPPLRHLMFLFADHFEPESAEQVRDWVRRYAELASRHADSSGRRPQHVWFYWDTKPIYFFGAMALLLFLGASVSGAFVIIRKLFWEQSMIRNPLLLLTVMLIVLSAMCIMLGLLAELMVRTYHESQNKPVYVIRQVLGDALCHGTREQ